MRESLGVTGGAQIGWVNVSWPLARLTASRGELSVKAWLLGSYSFSPDEVAAIEKYGSIPVLASGVRIVHTNPTYPSNIVFWCFGSSRRLMAKIQELGFVPSAPLASVPRRNGIAFRWSFIIALAVAWNALFLLNGLSTWEQPRPPVSALVALGLLFLIATAVRQSPRFQLLALKPGRSVAEIQPLLALAQLVSGFLLVIFAVQYVIR